MTGEELIALAKDARRHARSLHRQSSASTLEVDKLLAMRGPGERYSDVILRLAKMEQ
jgi:hypothetical protein